MDPGLAGTLATAVWCLHRFHRLERDHLPQRGRSARLRAYALSWCAVTVVLAGAAACAVTAARVAAGPASGSVAGTLYVASCAVALGLLLVVESLVASYRLQLVKDAARRERRRASVRTLMGAAPDSRAPL